MGLYDENLGALLVGIFFNTFLYGLVTFQFAVYYRTKFDDPTSTKYMILFLFILDTFHSASYIYMAWYYTVTNYDNPADLVVGIWPYPFTAVGTAITALVTQIYLGNRKVIWRFTKSKILYGVVILLAIPSFGLGIVCGIVGWADLALSVVPLVTPIAIAWLTVQAFVDAFITTTLIIIFSRSRTGFRRTDTVLNRLIRGAIQTGLFTGIFSISALICFVVFPTTSLYAMLAIPLSRVYTNTFMDILLARESLKAELRRTCDLGEVLGAVNWPATDLSQATSELMSTDNPLPSQVKVQTTVEGTGNHESSSSENAEGKLVPSPA